jgi:hypothetical protein
LPEATWEYFIQVGNKWWTTIFGVWHGSAYTRTIRRTASGSVTVPWIVPKLYVHVEPARLDPLIFEDICSYSWEGLLGDSDSDENDSEVEVGATSIAGWWPNLAPRGVYSYHEAGGRRATYCEEEWIWT